jgi:hypothetical protein
MNELGRDIKVDNFKVDTSLGHEGRHKVNSSFRLTQSLAKKVDTKRIRHLSRMAKNACIDIL